MGRKPTGIFKTLRNFFSSDPAPARWSRSQCCDRIEKCQLHLLPRRLPAQHRIMTVSVRHTRRRQSISLSSATVSATARASSIWDAVQDYRNRAFFAVAEVIAVDSDREMIARGATIGHITGQKKYPMAAVQGRRHFVRGGVVSSHHNRASLSLDGP